MYALAERMAALPMQDIDFVPGGRQLLDEQPSDEFCPSDDENSSRIWIRLRR
jgi:hypothetical protein